MIAFTVLRDTRPSLWLAVYAVALLCVLSFIAFEVLDLDGSDFQTDPRHVTFKPAEAEHDAVRRASLTPVNAALVSPIAAADERLVLDERLASTSTRPQPPPSRRPARVLLARASLGDVPPAA